MKKADLAGRITGMAVFMAGIGLLAFVFLIAYHWFKTPSAAIVASPNPNTGASTFSQLGKSVLVILEKMALLVVMTIAASLVASRGVQLYFASGSVKPPSIAPKDE
ncbi:MAG: hypothetical protein QHI38_04495 [Armatimonadota bacterium]|nr:hypothetical protein [Armatimonadota bacterium]